MADEKDTTVQTSEPQDGAGESAAATQTETAAPEVSRRESIEKGFNEQFETDKFGGVKPKGAAESKVDAKGTGKGAQAPAAKKGPAQVATAVSKTAAAAATTSIKGPPPPKSWNAQERQHWEAVADPVKAAILRRETEAARLVSQWKPAVDHLQAFKETVAPFEHIMRQQAAMSGQPYNPLRTVQTLMTTGATLMHGTPLQKAQTVASIISGYGVDLEQLVAALEGKAPQQGAQGQQQQQQFNPQAFLAQAVQLAKQQFAAEFEQSTGQRDLRQSQAEVQSFGADKEYFEDVKEYMAYLNDLHAARMARLPEEQRVAADLDELYRKACLEHPVVGPIVKQQEEAAAAEKARASTQAAQRAASSIRSRPGGSGKPAGQPKSRREVIAAALEAQLEQ